MIAALGGTERIAALESLEAEAECLGPGGAFHTTVRSLRPGKVAFLQTTPTDRTDIRSTPTRTWSVSADGKVEKRPASLRAFVRGHEFHLLMFEVYERFHDHAVRGRRTMDGRPCLGIDMLDESGRPASLCLDEATHLPIALGLNPEGAEGPITILFHDWAPVDGVSYFWSFTLTEGTRGFRYAYVGIRPGVVSKELFD